MVAGTLALVLLLLLLLPLGAGVDVTAPDELGVAWPVTVVIRPVAAVVAMVATVVDAGARDDLPFQQDR